LLKVAEISSNFSKFQQISAKHTPHNPNSLIVGGTVAATPCAWNGTTIASGCINALHYGALLFGQ
jgi:hypothetical protein